MHEQKLIRNLLDTLSEEARRHGARRILGVRLRLPEGGHLEREGFLAQFEIASQGSAAQGAEVELLHGPLPDEHSIRVESIRLEDCDRKRFRAALFGGVQGTGFRPFVHRLASELGLAGWVSNDNAGLLLEAEGPEQALRDFRRRLISEKPSPAVIAAIEETWLEPAGETAFEIRQSRGDSGKSAWLLPDLATCGECRKETLEPGGRRFGYPFTNCARCGPRFTLVRSIPYDRANTSMQGFSMCPDCAREYSDPGDRRFHAQPIACPACGPRVWLEIKGVRREGDALEETARLIENGKIVAVKGIGGFHLICDARSARAVGLLRERKRREEKPFAVMFPSMEAIRAACDVSSEEEDWLASSSAPIVLLRKLRTSGRGGPVSEEVAPGNPNLGVFLPYSPLHHLLIRRLGFPVVATSGNLTDEPIAATNEAGRERLGRLVDAILMHDRPIERPVDDSIVRMIRGRQSVSRRARGLAPLPIRVSDELRPVLAVGGHLKNTVSIAWGRQIVTSQHLGDLDTAASWEAFQAAVKDLLSLYDFKPEAVACDLHPDYKSTSFAESMDLPVIRVQHHHAHIAACMAEQGVVPPVLGVAWDGLGLGTDGSLWGGEFLAVDEAGFRRLGHLKTFPLPGGEAAVREPRRAALGLLTEAGLDVGRLQKRFDSGWEALQSLPAKPEFSPKTSSIGRLFDAAASLIGLRQKNSFEGQAAMALEHAIGNLKTEEAYPFPMGEPCPGTGARLADWGPMLSQMIEDIDRGTDPGLLSARFHNALARLILEAARISGLEKVVLSGGVFQNAYLTEKAVSLLESDGFRAFTHQRLPANDGGLSAGQAFLAGMGWHPKGGENVSCNPR